MFSILNIVVYNNYSLCHSLFNLLCGFNCYLFPWTDDFPETVGIERIIEALEAHLWPNMVMKGMLQVRMAKSIVRILL